MRLPSSWLLLLLALCATGAPAREVYKCTTRQGGIAFQDQPCAAGDKEAMVHVTDAAPRAPPQDSATDAAPAPLANAPPPPQPRRPRTPLPALWLCTNAEDGSFYASRSGPPPPRAVPLGVLGFTTKSLAEAYRAGANVMSAPELNKPPIDRSPQAAAGAGYTLVQDTCVAANPEQTCAYLRQQFDLTSDKLGHARFKDEQGRLQAQIDRLDDDLGGCP